MAGWIFYSHPHEVVDPMTTPTQLRALAERVRTEEASRELFVDTARALGWRQDYDGLWRINPTDTREWAEPNWFHSIDAAASVMPEGWRIRRVEYIDGGWVAVAIRSACDPTLRQSYLRRWSAS